MKTCSKTLFKKWIDDVRRAYRRIPEIKAKIAYFESQLDGYHAVTYDSIGVKTYGNSQERSLLSAIYKISYYDEKLKKFHTITSEYKNLSDKLKKNEKNLLFYLIETNIKSSEICVIIGISKSMYYQHLNNIMKIFKLSVIPVSKN
ncbi:hypothetical protein [Liberiplasma polymorphum]|uniref:hypothetical protein n=1 Tax=Liberiplasma polymorphum TaxID=3374570 RepID=UPI00377237B0